MRLPSVLVVDDVAMFRELMAGFLAKSAVEVQSAADGQEALIMARNKRPALIFLDLHMPIMDGAACCRALKADPSLRDIPVVMLLAGRKASERQLCLDAGCDAIITKPIDRREFLELAYRCVHRVERRDARYPCQATVVFTHKTGSYYGTSIDISDSGLFVATNRCLPMNEHVKINVLLSTSPTGGGDTRVVEATGRIAWCNSGLCRPKKDLPEGMGIELREIQRDCETTWRHYLSSFTRNRPYNSFHA